VQKQCVSLSTQWWRENGGRKCWSKRCSRLKVEVASAGASGARVEEVHEVREPPPLEKWRRLRKGCRVTKEIMWIGWRVL